MHNQTFLGKQAEFSFSEMDSFKSEAEALETALHVAALLFIVTMRPLKAPLPSQAQLQEVLDFVGPRGHGRECWAASVLLERGRLDYGIEDEWAEISQKIRTRCSHLMESGRAGKASLPRRRKPRSGGGQGGLF